MESVNNAMQHGLSEEDLTRMNRVLRHRLRNLASGIKSTVAFLSRELAGRLAPQELEYFPLILNECDALSDLTGRMSLLFDDMPSGVEMIARDLLQDWAVRFHERFPTSALEVKAETAFQEARLESPQWISTAVLELLANAVEAAPAKPVFLEGRLEGETAVVSVRDSGPGVRDEDLAQCLKPFYTTKVKHLGIGLPIAARWVARLKGQLKTERHSAGGLIWELRWPLQRAAPAETAAQK
jgi:signal transduction histidine kinase